MVEARLIGGLILSYIEAVFGGENAFTPRFHPKLKSFDDKQMLNMTGQIQDQ